MATSAFRVLFVDDDADSYHDSIRWLDRHGHDVATANSLHEAKQLAAQMEFDVVVAELEFPGGFGLDLLRAIRGAGHDTEVILLTDHGSVESAVQAMKLGIFDYLLKPCRPAELEKRCLRASQAARLRQASRIGKSGAGTEMVGRCDAMVELHRMIGRLGPSDLPVLIEGESGTGKELVAGALYRASRRADSQFVAINCAALPEQLLESEFFGHEKGAFTGSVSAKPGLFETADGGTLFIDEIAELALPLQAKLLRGLENGTYRRVGAVTERRADVRILAATNHDLGSEVAAGRFREDLYYRINVVTLRLPPLRDRSADIPRLVDSFLGCDWQLDPEALKAVENYCWPGNVRQLRNALERAKVLASRNVIQLCDLPTEVAIAACGLRPKPAGDDIESQRREHVLRVLAREGGNKSRTARLLGLDRRSLYRLLDRYSTGGHPSEMAGKPR